MGKTVLELSCPLFFGLFSSRMMSAGTLRVRSQNVRVLRRRFLGRAGVSFCTVVDLAKRGCLIVLSFLSLFLFDMSSQ